MVRILKERLNYVYHGSKIKIKIIDLNKIQQRDYGFYGEGFYVTGDYEWAKTYGNVISTYRVDPKADILYVNIQAINTDKNIVNKIIYWYNKTGIEKAKKKGKEDKWKEWMAFLDIYSDHIEWKTIVDEYAKANRIDIVYYGNSEIVVKNPTVLEFIR